MIRPGEAVGTTLVAVARDILGEAVAAIDDPKRADAVAVHDFRKAMKRWRALLRLASPLLPPPAGEDCERMRLEARDLARELAGARDAQSALDALDDLKETEEALATSAFATMRRRIEAIRQAAEAMTLTEAMRGRLRAAGTTAMLVVGTWPVDGIDFPAVAGQLAQTYRRARRAIPEDWTTAGVEALHELRTRVVVHRYQMDLVEPLWPRMGKLWIAEAQRLRDRLGAYHDLSMLRAMTAPHQPLARWRSRLAAPIAAAQGQHVAAAARLTGRLFAEKPRAFRRRLEALWESRT